MKESSSTETTSNVGGSETQTTTYTYATGWFDRPLDSSSFHDSAGHRNPGSFPLSGDQWTSPSVTVGAFALTEEQAASIGGGAGLELTDDDLAQAQELFSDRLVREGQYLMTGDPASPTVGDLRVRYEVVHPQTVSLIARQSGDGVAPYVTSNDRELFMLERGGRTAEEMFADAQRANTILTWILRGVGTFLMWLGLTLILRPLSVIASVLPILGNVAEKGIGLVAAMMTAPLALFTAAFAWVFYRPVVGVGLLAVGAVLFYLFKQAGDKKTGTPPPLPQG
ncbi:MAG: TMEM43 family protein [Nitrospinae bacterium]|nr:TMEM43 family protein [Nitrospinota bacterium]